jgi:hypothetical protein
MAPAVAFDGTHYFVVWEDRRDGIPHIYGARVDQLGNILDTTGIAISSSTDQQAEPSVAFDGTNYLVVWCEQNSGSPDIYGTRVSSAGMILDTVPIPISTVADTQRSPSVSFDGANYFVTWEDYRNGSSDIYGARVSEDGSVLDTLGIAISTHTADQEAPKITYGGAYYLVAWQEGNVHKDIYGARIHPNGTVVDTAGIEIVSLDYYEMMPSVAYNGTDYLVVWIDYYNFYPNSWVCGARVNQSGVVLDTAGLMIGICGFIGAEGVYPIPSVSSNGLDYLITWGDKCTTVDQNGNVSDTLWNHIHFATNVQEASSCAFDGTNYLVIWHDKCVDPVYLSGMRIDQAGNAIDSIPIRIGRSYGSNAIAFGTIDYLAVWAYWDSLTSIDIYGARVDSDGNVLDTNNIIISSDAGWQQGPDVAFDGTNFMVVWLDGPDGDRKIFGTRVNQSGVVLDTSGILISSFVSGSNPSIAFDGINYMVVWSDVFNIYGALVDQSGTVISSDIPLSNTVIGQQWHPKITFDGTNYIITWTDNYNNQTDVFAERVTTLGEVIDTGGVVINHGPGLQGDPSITAFDGSNCLIIYQAQTSGNGSFSDHIDLHGAVFNSATGNVVDSFAICTDIGDQGGAALADGPGDQVLVTYSGWTYSVGGTSYNSIRLWGKLYPFLNIREHEGKTVPESKLSICPNPFKVLAHIKCYNRNLSSRIFLKIYDATGRVVKDFRFKTDRLHNTLSWDGRDDSGRQLPSGVYFLKFQAGEVSATEKVLLIR